MLGHIRTLIMQLELISEMLADFDHLMWPSAWNISQNFIKNLEDIYGYNIIVHSITSPVATSFTIPTTHHLSQEKLSRAHTTDCCSQCGHCKKKLFSLLFPFKNQDVGLTRI